MDNVPNTILIVDDDDTLRETLTDMLADEGYQFMLAANGPEALALLDDRLPDVIVLDVMMPKMSGFTVCRYLKAEPTWAHIPIILVTALDSKSDIVKGLDAGADEFLSKPVHLLELRARVRSMLRIKKQYDALKEMLQLRHNLTTMMVHDMRTPLSIITMHNRMLEKHLPIEALSHVETISHQTATLDRFCNDVLMLAKTEHSNLVINPTHIDLTELVTKVESYHQAIAKAWRVQFIVNIPKEPHYIYVDENLLHRVLDNLLSNAMKFSANGKSVILDVNYVSSEAPNKTTIRVIDEGPGIPSEYHERIFDKYEIAPLKKQNVAQTGLGLAFSKMVIEAHNGTISVANNHPKGAIFTITI